MYGKFMTLVVLAATGGMLLATPSDADRLGPPSSGDLYGRVIGIETNAGSTVAALAGELKEQLEDMVGMEFAVTSAAAHARGILLLRSAADLPIRYPDLAEYAVKLAALADCSTEGYGLFFFGWRRAPVSRGQIGRRSVVGGLRLPLASRLAGAAAGRPLARQAAADRHQPHA